MKLSVKEKNLLVDLLNIASSGWYTDEAVYPKGVKSKEEAEQMIKTLIKKISK